MHPAMQRTIIRSLAMTWGAFGLVLGAIAMASLSMVGFPDGHITAYEAETLALRRALIGLCLIQALIIPWMILRRRGAPPRYVLIAVSAAILLIIAPLLILPSCAASETCRRGYEMMIGRPMNHGVGG